jgi:hypothetical protein
VQRVNSFDQEYPMLKYVLPTVACLALGIATPATAYDSGGLISMQTALDVANDIGLASVSHTEFWGDKWDIEGRDRLGRYMEVAVDASTGDVLWVNR